MDNKREMRIYGVPERSIEKINNIAKNIGTTASDLLKPIIAEVINKYPDHMKQPPNTKD